jgi:hypothetical protein
MPFFEYLRQVQCLRCGSQSGTHHYGNLNDVSLSADDDGEGFGCRQRGWSQSERATTGDEVMQHEDVYTVCDSRVPKIILTCT